MSPVFFQVFNHHGVSLLKVCDPTGIAGVGLGGGVWCVGHGGARQERGAVHQDFIPIHIMVINVFNLSEFSQYKTVLLLLLLPHIVYGCVIGEWLPFWALLFNCKSRMSLILGVISIFYQNGYLDVIF